jgi:hypothetical protein
MNDFPDGTTETDWVQFRGSIDMETDTELTLVAVDDRSVSITFLRSDIYRKPGGIFIRKGCKIVRSVGIGSDGATKAIIVCDAEVVKRNE